MPAGLSLALQSERESHKYEHYKQHSLRDKALRCRSTSHSTWAWILKETVSRCMKKRKKFCSRQKTHENNVRALITFMTFLASQGDDSHWKIRVNRAKLYCFTTSLFR